MNNLTKLTLDFSEKMEESITEGVHVKVESFYLDLDSKPDEDFYVFAYLVKLKNISQITVKLLRRHWIITDSNGEINDVKGEGVVGEQPILKPGDEYQYNSGSHLKSPMGTMQGSYIMTSTEGIEFEVKIPCFTLAVPGIIN